jgi:hypothetical protein
LEDEVLAALDPDERETPHQLLAKALGPRGTCGA